MIGASFLVNSRNVFDDQYNSQHLHLLCRMTRQPYKLDHQPHSHINPKNPLGIFPNLHHFPMPFNCSLICGTQLLLNNGACLVSLRPWLNLALRNDHFETKTRKTPEKFLIYQTNRTRKIIFWFLNVISGTFYIKIFKHWWITATGQDLYPAHGRWQKSSLHIKVEQRTTKRIIDKYPTPAPPPRSLRNSWTNAKTNKRKQSEFERRMPAWIQEWKEHSDSSNGNTVPHSKSLRQWWIQQNCDVVKNILRNRLHELNNKIDKSWLELSLNSFKIKCKTWQILSLSYILSPN